MRAAAADLRLTLCSRLGAFTISTLCCRFGPSPGTSCHTHDSARSLHLAGRSKAPRLSLERLARTLHTAGPKRGSADSLASTAHSLGSAESLPGRSASLLAAEEAAAAEALRLEEVTTPRGIGLSTSLVSPRPRHSSEEDEAQAFDPSSLPGLGTWAQRQFHFQPRADSPQAELAGTPTLAVPQPSRGASRRCTQDEDDAVAAAAWRWRFNRRCALALLNCLLQPHLVPSRLVQWHSALAACHSAQLKAI